MLPPKRRFSVAIGVLVLGLAGWAPLVAAESPPVFIRAWGSQGSGDGQFNQPTCIAVDQGGNVYVTDSNNNRIQKFDSSGIFLAKWGSYGTGNGQFSYPWGIAVDGAGNVFVADGFNDRIQKFDEGGAFIAKWGSSGSGAGQFTHPRGIAVDVQGHLFVVDGSNVRIQEFDSNGGFLRQWPTHGGPYTPSPQDVAVGSGGRVYVTDGFLSDLVEVYDPLTGDLLFTFGSRGGADGQFSAPEGIATDVHGNVFVADWSYNRIQKFDSEGLFLTKWGSFGSGDGQFGECWDVAVDDTGYVYVLDQAYDRVQKFGPAVVPTLPTTWGAVKARWR